MSIATTISSEYSQDKDKSKLYTCAKVSNQVNRTRKKVRPSWWMVTVFLTSVWSETPMVVDTVCLTKFFSVLINAGAGWLSLKEHMQLTTLSSFYVRGTLIKLHL